MKGRRECNAKSKRTGQKCRGIACRGSSKCRVHGGKGSGRPPIHGRYSKKLGPLRAAFDTHLEARDIFGTKPELALMDSVVEELLTRAFDGDAPGWRRELLTLGRQYRKAKRSPAPEADPEALLDQLFDMIEKGADRDRALLDATNLADRRANRAQRERLTEAKAAYTLTRAQVLASYALFIRVVCENTQPRVAQRIVEECRRRLVLGGGDEGDGDVGGEALRLAGVP